MNNYFINIFLRIIQKGDEIFLCRRISDITAPCWKSERQFWHSPRMSWIMPDEFANSFPRDHGEPRPGAGTTDCNVAVAFWQLAFCRSTCTIDLEQSRKPREVTHAAKNPKSSISSNVHVAIVIVVLVTSPQFFNFIRSKRLNWVYRDGFSNTKIIIVLQLNFYLNCFSLDII